jgi:hypothetical protein
LATFWHLISGRSSLLKGKEEEKEHPTLWVKPFYRLFFMSLETYELLAGFPTDKNPSPLASTFKSLLEV